ncbi:T9SS type A sorting domain-containing protein [Aquimarina pacifica]|uniref:T9SS type A sorting domain-containing protein n=1 Tax=Aquimarina pacifica TaxID=1296415 RepID=UPI0004702AAE|nr:T9SS type A sorting domain-containing protein [Aquimarina pacifica]
MKNYLAQVLVLIISTMNLLSAQTSTPMSELRVRNDDPSWNNETWGRCEYYTYWGCDEEPGNEKGDRYVIIVEGIDANNDFNLDDFEEVFGNTRRLLNSKGIEVVYVNFGDGADFIENNAAVLEAVIRDINRTKEGNHENVVVGVSMGGLVARMALVEMERTFDPEEDGFHKQHLTKLFLSVDSPQKGANVPVGLQLLVEDLSTVLNQSLLSSSDQVQEKKPIVASRLRKLNNPAAKQLLLYYKGDDSHQWFKDLQAKMDDSYYPENCTNIALTNGSLQYGLSGISPGSKIWSVDEYLYEDKFLSRRMRLHIESQVNAEPNGHGQVYNFRANMIVRLFGADIIYDGPLSFDINKSFSGTFTPYSHLNGGTLDSQGGIQSEGFGQVSGNGHHSFIPTLSAFGIHPNKYSMEFGQTQSEENWRNILEMYSPFDRIYYDDDVYQNFSASSYNGLHTFSITDTATSLDGNEVGRYDDELGQILLQEMMMDEVRVQDITFSQSDEGNDYSSASVIRVSGAMPQNNNGDHWITDQSGEVILNSYASVNLTAAECIDFTPGVTINHNAKLTAIIDASLEACPFNELAKMAQKTAANLDEYSGKDEYIISESTIGNFITSNPSNGQILLKTGIQGAFNFVVMSYDGQILYESIAKDGALENVSFLPSGLYILKVLSETKIITQKVIIK